MSLLQKAQHFYNLAMGETVVEEEHEMVDSRDTDLHRKYHEVLRNASADAYKELEDEIAHRKLMDDIFDMHFNLGDENAPESPVDWKCYKRSVLKFEEACGQFSSYGFKFARKIHQKCDAHPHLVEKALEAAAKMCKAHKK